MAEVDGLPGFACHQQLYIGQFIAYLYIHSLASWTWRLTGWKPHRNPIAVREGKKKINAKNSHDK
jgi:hypothetical protein